MNQIKHEGMFSVVQPGDSGMSLPFIYEEAGVVTLYFGWDRFKARCERIDPTIWYCRTPAP